MRLKLPIGIAVGVLFLGAVAFFWPSKSEQTAKMSQGNMPSKASTLRPAPGQMGAVALTAAAAKHAPASAKTYRLSNTPKTMAQLGRDSRAVLLRNAIIDTASSGKLDIPESLRAGENPGSYVVHAQTGVDQRFYDALRQAGAVFVSYIPNDAALVTATASAAEQLQASRAVDSVLSYQPYYKLDPSLLPEALGDRPVTSSTLGITASPNGADAMRDRLKAMGLIPIAEERTPFGTQFIVERKEDQTVATPSAGSVPLLVVLARESLVLDIEPSVRRALLNDLTRPRVGVSADSQVATNYLQLTGRNVIVAVNDTGVDAQHPDLIGRVFASSGAPSWLLTDSDFQFGAGHGTHVAGIIAGNGSKSDTVSNAPGSVRDADGNYAIGQFRGMAQEATLFVQPIDLVTGPLVSDAYLQESASKSNAVICHNSWGNPGRYGYTMASASYDAATRDAQPDTTGSQPLLFVFAAGNDGSGGNDGTGGQTDTISSPATAKNVITVGALESPRNIANEVHLASGTSSILARMTDSDIQVAGFSSRGNVGIGVEGEYGRYKPDVVAPGVFIVSTRSSSWTNPVAGADVQSIFNANQNVLPGATNINEVSVPDGGTLMLVQITANANSPTPFPANLVIYADTNANPTTARSGEFAVTPGTWHVGVYNPNSQPISYDLGIYILVTNASGDYYDVLAGINNQLKPSYRFDSGTSMAASAVSGVLALMQQYFVETLKMQPSPALMKALLINGSSVTANYYDYQVNKPGANDEGWGLVNVASSIRPGMTTNSPGPLMFFDQSVDGSLATGESCVRTINISPDATDAPLRVTLVWTDPPGNPAASIKLVNDLDLVVSNTLTGEVYVGNNFPANDTYTQTNSSETSVAASDIVNNVENVYIEGTSDLPLSGSYVVIVKAKRVNVNAVTAHTNNIVQDYALVISSGSVVSTTPISITQTVNQTDQQPWVMPVINGVPLLYQRVGANSPLLGGTNGTDVQWRFYTFSNSISATTNSSGSTNSTYVAFVTFMPPNLSTPRNFDADIDLYVSTNQALVYLDPAAVSGADKSLNRGGSESIIYTNSVQGTVYYVGVKAEDQKAAEFGLFAVASGEPFSAVDINGNIVARGIGVPLDLPDGSPQNPHQTNLLCISMDTIPGRTIRHVNVRERIIHKYAGDIYALLGHGEASGTANQVWLNNHSDFGTNTVVFDDSGETADAISTDGPGSLNAFVGQPVNNVWLTTLWDNASGDDGQVMEFSVEIAPRRIDMLEYSVKLTNSWYLDYIDLPTDVTNLNISIVFKAGSGPVDILLRKADFPTLTDYDFEAQVTAPGGFLNVSITNTPPISAGRWFYGLHNASSADVTVDVVIRVGRSLTPDLTKTYFETNVPVALLEDARTQSTIFVPDSKLVLATSVGVRLNDDRVSDLAITLTSPQGTRVMLFENRGGTSSTGLGFGSTTMVYTVFTENANWFPQPIKFATPPLWERQRGDGDECDVVFQ